MMQFKKLLFRLAFVLVLLFSSNLSIFANENVVDSIQSSEASTTSIESSEASTDSVDSGDTAWLLVSTALVMLMTPGLALFYGGMVRRKNVLGTIMHSFIMLCVVSIVWILWGYSLAFGNDIGGFIGDLSMFALNGVGTEANGTIPHILFMMFQGMFAVITPALISGAYAERIKFSSMIVFSVLWVSFVYAPICHWVWGGGFIHSVFGALDFAGGNVVHINSAAAALAAAMILGKRAGYLKEPMIPHNLPMTFLGLALLWFGWFGFNAGSALTSGALASVAFVTTNTAAAAGALGWLVVESFQRKKATIFGSVSGAVAGLVSITPAAGFVNPMGAIIIGFVGGILCYIAVTLRPKLGYDDSLDVVGIHGIGGIWGAISVGIFATAVIGGTDGLLYGNPSLVVTQLISVVITIAYSLCASFIILKVIDLVMGLRVSKKDETDGLDLSQHGEEGYSLSK